MKKNSLLLGLLFSICVANTNAQWVIDNTKRPVIGDNYAYKLATYASTPKTISTGGNYATWTFSNLTDSISYNLQYEDTTGKTNISKVRPRANMSLNETGVSMPSFYNNSGNTYRLIGEAFVFFNTTNFIPYKNGIDLLNYPMVLDGSVTTTDSADWIFNMGSSNKMKRTITSSTTYDGLGSLNIDTHTSIDSVVRIKIVQDIKDTVVQPGAAMQFKILSTRTIYYWFLKNTKKPILVWQKEYSYSPEVSFIDPITTYKMLVDRQTLAINKIDYDKNVSLYPNPTSSILNIKAEAVNQLNYTVYNIIGEPIKTGTLSSSANQLDISNLAKGIYILELSDSKGKTTKRFIKE